MAATPPDCQLPLGQLQGRSITTVEGLAGEALHPVQHVWGEQDMARLAMIFIVVRKENASSLLLCILSC